MALILVDVLQKPLSNSLRHGFQMARQTSLRESNMPAMRWLP
jgi:hypothetical protein